MAEWTSLSLDNPPVSDLGCLGKFSDLGFCGFVD